MCGLTLWEYIHTYIRVCLHTVKNPQYTAVGSTKFWPGIHFGIFTNLLCTVMLFRKWWYNNYFSVLSDGILTVCHHTYVCTVCMKDCVCV